jgi:hypothetical protein
MAFKRGEAAFWGNRAAKSVFPEYNAKFPILDESL